MNDTNYQSRIDSLYRLISFDHSHEFNIIVNIANNENLEHVENVTIEKKSQIIIKTTINKARVISSLIDQAYQTEHSLNQYEINLNNIKEKKKTNKIIQVFQLLFDSIGKQIIVPEDIQNLFILILNQLGEKYQQTNDNNNNNESHDQPYNIISYYKNWNKEHPNEISKIKVSAGNNGEQHNVDNMFRYDTYNICDFYYKFFSHNSSNKTNERYIEFDFKKDKVKIESCKIETYDFCRSKTLKIAGSNDHLYWDTLVHCNDSSQLQNDQVKVFQCQKSSQYYQFIRYIEIQPNNTNDNVSYLKCMNIKSIEFEGYISSEEKAVNNDENANTDEMTGYSDLFTLY